MTDVKKVIALNRLRAQMLDEEVSPAQKQYYLELAQWLENQNIQTAEEATKSIKNTPYYDGAALAKELDGTTGRRMEIKNCPVCGQPLKKRNGRFGEFWGCTGFPKCRYTENI